MVVLGIRPDFIRTSKVLRLLKNHPKIDAVLVHTGQHYDRELNGVFFEELNVPFPDIQLDCRGSHCQQHSKLIAQLEPVIKQHEPDVCLFLGDANATIGCIAPLKLGIPIAHIEAGMRSYNWKMPEERNRVIIDRVSDVLYVYQDDYRLQLVQEGIDPGKIVVVGNVIVDVINEHKKDFRQPEMEWLPNTKLKYALMTLHRDEHMNKGRARQIIDDVGRATRKRNLPVILIEMPRLKALNIKYPDHFVAVPPLGYLEFGWLEQNATIEYTDSGTNQESASILGTPCVVTRECTERPECRDSNTTVLSGYRSEYIEEATRIVLRNKPNEGFSLGDGNSSQRIVDDLVVRLDRKFKHKYRGGGSGALKIDIFKSEHSSLL
jgi:UDP-N-acetylglucosamine 2-epimerase (non-hydrolysing)